MSITVKYVPDWATFVPFKRVGAIFRAHNLEQANRPLDFVKREMVSINPMSGSVFIPAIFRNKETLTPPSLLSCYLKPARIHKTTRNITSNGPLIQFMAEEPTLYVSPPSLTINVRVR